MKFVGTGLVLLASMTVVGTGFAQDTPRPAKVFTLQAVENELVRRYPAIVLPSREVDLSFRVSGRVIELPIRGAMDVRQGDVIARLDTRELESRVAQLESQVDQAGAQLTALRLGGRAEEVAALAAQVVSAEAQLAQARDKFERTRKLVERGVMASAAQVQDEAAFRVAKAAVDAQQEQLALAQTSRPEDIAAAEAASRGLEAQLKSARDDLADATLRAPFTGIIARRTIENFTNVQAGSSIAILQALDPLHMHFDVPGPDVTALTAHGLDKIKNTVTFQAMPGQMYAAEVVEFSVQADTGTQTYRGRAAVNQPEGAFILPGMVGNVIATAPAKRDALRIPLTAVAASPDGASFVWLLSSDNTVSKRDVELGKPTGAFVDVIEGLAAGDTVISAGVSQIMDGMTVRPILRVGG